MKMAIFGVGELGKKFLSTVLDDEYDHIVVAFDNDSGYWGKSIDGCDVVSPELIKEYDIDCVVITSSFQNEIENQLKNYLSTEKIFRIEDYQRVLHTRKQYYNKYTDEYKKKEIDFLESKIAIYTAITGEYDHLEDPQIIVDGVDYICFTNNSNIKSDVWNIRLISNNSLSNMYLAKKVKLFPNEFLDDYETSIWVDGKFQIKGNLTEYIELYQKREPMLCFPHFSRVCLYEEAARCIVDGIGIKEDIIHQITEYKESGYPCDNGLYEMGCIVRKHNDDRVISLMESWWNEIVTFSYRDQISFPYVCWKAGFSPDICDQNIYKNKWLSCKRNHSKAFGRL